MTEDRRREDKKVGREKAQKTEKKVSPELHEFASFLPLTPTISAFFVHIRVVHSESNDKNFNFFVPKVIDYQTKNNTIRLFLVGLLKAEMWGDKDIYHTNSGKFYKGASLR